MKTGIIFDIQGNSFVDGPGIRTTVFFKGCNLKCVWCHNPESRCTEPQIMFYKNKCTGCGRCRGITAADKDFICYNDAKEICGREYIANEVLDEVLKDKPFYENSVGGVTFSGGECMLQIDFLCEVLRKCKENGIHTAVDTAGNVPWEYFEKVIPLTDLFLYDIKAVSDDIHQKYTAVSNELILSNLKKLFEAGAKVWIRIPFISDVNDTEEEMHKIKDFLAPYKPLKVEILPYHRMGEHKYAALGMDLKSFDVPDKAKTERFNKLLAK